VIGAQAIRALILKKYYLHVEISTTTRKAQLGILAAWSRRSDEINLQWLSWEMGLLPL